MNDFEREIEPFKDKIIQIAEKWEGVTKFELKFVYSFNTDVSVSHYKTGIKNQGCGKKEIARISGKWLSCGDKESEESQTTYCNKCAEEIRTSCKTQNTKESKE